MVPNIDNKHWTLKHQYIKEVYIHVVSLLSIFSASCAMSHMTQLSYDMAMKLSLLSILSIMLSFINRANVKFWIYFTASSLGIGLHPAINTCLHEGYHNEIYMALFGTIIVFATLTSIVAMSDSRKFLFIGGPLLSSLFVILVVGLVNTFILKSPIMHTIEIIFGLIVFSLYVIYDTSVILNRTELEINDFNCIFDAMSIFLDIINIFIRILMMLMIMKIKDKEKEERRKKKESSCVCDTTSSLLSF